MQTNSIGLHNIFSFILKEIILKLIDRATIGVNYLKDVTCKVFGKIWVFYKILPVA